MALGSVSIFGAGCVCIAALWRNEDDVTGAQITVVVLLLVLDCVFVQIVIESETLLVAVPDVPVTVSV